MHPAGKERAHRRTVHRERRPPANPASFPELVPFGPELARLLARHEVTIDVHSPGATHGYSHTPLPTFASGGFMLVVTGRRVADELLVSATRSSLTVTIELPRRPGIKVVFRNAAETASRAFVLEAGVCDRRLLQSPDRLA